MFHPEPHAHEHTYTSHTRVYAMRHWYKDQVLRIITSSESTRKAVLNMNEKALCHEDILGFWYMQQIVTKEFGALFILRVFCLIISRQDIRIFIPHYSANARCPVYLQILATFPDESTLAQSTLRLEPTALKAQPYVHFTFALLVSISNMLSRMRLANRSLITFLWYS